MKLADRLLKKFGLQRRTDAGFSDKWYPKSGLGGMSAAGQNVNESTAMNLSAVWCAVNLISNTIKSLPITACERMAIGGRQPLPDHIVTTLLHRRPNPVTKPSAFRKLLTSWVLLWGNGYAEIRRDANGVPEALWPIHPRKVTVEWNKAKREPLYQVLTDDNRTVPIKPENMFHLMGHSTDGLHGVSVIQHARDSMGLSLATEQHGARTFANGATPPLIIEHPGNLGTDKEAIEAFRDRWQTLYGGANTGKVGVLENGMKPHVVGMPNDDAQFLETRLFQIPEIGRWFVITPYKLMDFTHATYSNIEWASLDYKDDAILPWTIEWKDEANLKLFMPQEQGRLYVKFNLNSMIQMDTKAKMEAYRISSEIGHLSINERRELEDLNPLPDEIGDIRLVPMNMQTVEDLVAEDPEPEPQPIPPQLAAPVAEPEEEPEEEDRASVGDIFTPLIVQALERCARKESKAVEAARKRCNGCGGKLEAWADTFYVKHLCEIVNSLMPILLAARQAAGQPSVDITPLVVSWARLRCASAAAGLGRSDYIWKDHDFTPDARALLGAWSKTDE